MEQKLTRRQISDAVEADGWRLVLEALQTSVRVGSLTGAAEVAALAAAAGGDQRLFLDLRPERVVLTLPLPARMAATARDLEAAHQISAALRADGHRTEPGADRSVQLLEIAIDALDIAAIRPFWLAVLGYTPDPVRDGPEDQIADPLGAGPALWFQPMESPRPQRNRIHLDISVPHDEAPRRLEAALAAGGHIVADDRAPAFWVLADPEGNEACITTWQSRD